MIVTLIVTSTLIIITLATIVIILLFRYQKKNQLFSANINTLNLEYEKNILQASIEVQENTFKHVSREIHDNIGLSLTLAKLNLNIVSENLTGIHLSRVVAAKEVLTDAISSLSHLSKGLNADLIYEIGLIEYLRIETERINKLNVVNLKQEIGGNPVFLDPDKELILARIIQESLNNILKHSKATLASIFLYYDEDKLKMTISDNGVGIACNPNEAVSSGIRNMHSRAKLLGGHLQILSKEHVGTTIDLIIPINCNDRQN